MDKLQKFILGAYVLALVAIILATIAFYFPRARQFGAAAVATATEGLRDWTNFDNIRTGALEATATSTVGEEFRLGNKYYRPISGTCDDASPTLANVINYNGATSTLRHLRIDGQNGTTTITLQAGTTSVATLLGGSAVQPVLINSVGIGTSTYFIIDGGTPPNNASTSQGAVIFGGGATTSGASTYPSIMLGPTDRFFIRATSTTQNQAASGDDTLEGLTNTNNQFSCTWDAILER